jgi:hypothetical protein
MQSWEFGHKTKKSRWTGCYPLRRHAIDDRWPLFLLPRHLHRNPNELTTAVDVEERDESETYSSLRSNRGPQYSYENQRNRRQNRCQVLFPMADSTSPLSYSIPLSRLLARLESSLGDQEKLKTLNEVELRKAAAVQAPLVCHSLT